MVCKKCNHNIPADSEFCQFCGEPVVINEVVDNVVKESMPGEKIVIKKKRLPLWLIIVLGALVGVLLAGNIILFVKTQQFKSAINDLKSTVNDLNGQLSSAISENEKNEASYEDTISSLNSQIKSLESKNRSLSNSNAKMKSTYDFYSEYAVVVPIDGSNRYHKYGCVFSDTSYFYIYNIENAKAQGYSACPYCKKYN